MDREKSRAELPKIADVSARQAQTHRVEASYCLGLAVSHLFMAKRGRVPTPEESERVRSAFEILAYDVSNNPTSEEKARVDYACQEIVMGFG